MTIVGAKRVLISLEIPDLLPWNRFSAVACVIVSIGKILNDGGYDVYINQYPFQEVYTKLQSIEGRELSVGVTSKLPYKFVPKRAREFIKDLVLFRKLNKALGVIKTIPKPDVIVAWVSYGSDNGLRLARFWNTPLISIYDNPLNEEYKFQTGFASVFSRLIEKREKRMIAGSNKVVAYSTAMADHLSQKYQLSRPFHFNQFVDLIKVNVMFPAQQTGMINIVFIGSFFKWHRIDSLVRVFLKLKEEFPFIFLSLVGDGPLIGEIRELVRTAPHKESIRFLGLMDRMELNNLLQNSHIGVIPNALWFHAPLKLFQYAAAGLCVVCPGTPTIQFIKGDNEDTFLTFKDEDELYTKLYKLLVNPSEIRQRGLNAMNFYIDNYNRDAYLTFFKSMFNSISE